CVQTYIIPIKGTPRTVRLRQQVFLPEDFRIYMDGRGGLVKSELARIEHDCFYEGYVEGFPISLVALSTCAGLSGVLQLVNASYGIKPLETAAGYQHLVYPMGNENIETRPFVENGSLVQIGEVPPKLEDATTASTPPDWYLEMHAVLDKALYDYLGADKDAVTVEIVQLFSYVNSMFACLNLTIVLSSLEFWMEKNKIPTMGDAEELLQRFLQWKKVHRVLRLQDIMFLFVYREQPRYVGYRRAMTLKTFAVVVAQLLGLSLGMAYGDPGSCHCAEVACIVQSSSMPAMDAAYKTPVCGNKIVEPGEACDCGTAEVSCGALAAGNCVVEAAGWWLAAGSVRASSVPEVVRHLDEMFVKRGTLCRSSSKDECELKEYCNGTSGKCTPDLWVMDGHPCSRNTALCYRGVCQTADKQCQKVFGQGAKNGPLPCYKEINSQRDRMGHCGSDRYVWSAMEWRSQPHGGEEVEHRWAPQAHGVNDGTLCDDHKICNNQGSCHCHPGWKPPTCQEKARAMGDSGSSPSDDEADVGNEGSPKLWLLLTFCLFVPVAIGLVLLAIRRGPRCCLAMEELDEG
ncbi:PREDICTED: disintegrin and metalloproteinase domain-containing protein 32-like, partial [Cariama cristata]|uniref:disintegrin and metalloproteinase domain-containing protein 32-like n=1 Tax=Cariama cristata TaxID=54380 RepID=UPI0005206B86